MRGECYITLLFYIEQMFAELPKILDRNFFVSYLLPSLVFFFINALLSWHLKLHLLLPTYYQPASKWKDNDYFNLYVGASILSFFIAIFLMLLNKPIFQFFEGYGIIKTIRWSTPFYLLQWLQVKHHRKIKDKLKKLDIRFRSVTNSYNTLSDSPEDEVLKEKYKKEIEAIKLQENTILDYFVSRFPHERTNVLPTSLGNTMRAFETYPNRMYNVDGVGIWNRLLCVLPSSLTESIGIAQSTTNCWLNLCVIFLLLWAETFLFGDSLQYQRSLCWFFAILACISYETTKSSAVEWGDLVKSAFDVYLEDLHSKLGYQKLQSREERLKFWLLFTQGVIYRQPKCLSEIANRPDT